VNRKVILVPETEQRVERSSSLRDRHENCAQKRAYESVVSYSLVHKELCGG